MLTLPLTDADQRGGRTPWPTLPVELKAVLPAATLAAGVRWSVYTIHTVYIQWSVTCCAASQMTAGQ